MQFFCLFPPVGGQETGKTPPCTVSENKKGEKPELRAMNAIMKTAPASHFL
jgi:hypothetical protein